ncbi:MAG: cobalamin-binding protein [Eubacteriaceae bacterium]|nr:cobalamin-binding protein [Eubacteriaceae bacterium]
MRDLELLKNTIIELEDDKVITLLDDFIAGNPTIEEAQKVLAVCQEAMAVIGDLFENGEYFVGDLIFAGEILTDALNIIKPVLGTDQNVKIGKIVLATVQGDLHDIGKNIFRSMAETAGFEVFDLGIDQPPMTIVEKVKETNADIVGMSSVLTLGVEAMKETVDALRANGLRDNVRIIIGGNPASKETCQYVGADAYTTNAAEGVKICSAWVK